MSDRPVPGDVRGAVDRALDDLPQPASRHERDRWRIVSRIALDAAEPLIRADERRRIAAGVSVDDPAPEDERLGLYRLAAANGALAERERWQAKLDAIRALLTSGPIGRSSGERYIRADLIRDVLDSQPEHLRDPAPEVSGL